VFVSQALKGFGKTLIIDHNDGYETVYAYNSELLIKQGDSVRQNDCIARVGSSGRASGPMLHFEIRKGGQPQNPLSYLSR
jgi:murein DD-endopeptidase MepM/ murein hydrolase activator NlpD